MSRKSIPKPTEKHTFIVEGSSGTQIYSGYFSEEYLQKIADAEGIKAFDEMRRSDGQVAMLLRCVKNPIRSASFEVRPATEDEAGYEQADFIKHVFFDDIGYLDGSKTKTFSAFIHEALTMIEFGFSAFEVVHKMVRNHPIYGDYMGLADLGFRHQRSILEWLLADNGAIMGVRQFVDGDLSRDVIIPGQFLLTYAIDKEGDSYQGISMLRPCYGAWFRKNLYRKLQGIGIERAAKGIPVGTLGPEFQQRSDYETQLTAFQALIDKLASHEKSGIVLPAGAGISQLKLTHDAEKVQTAIDSENIEMTKSFLANFMELGLQGNSGSFALGTDLSDIFLSGIQYIADQICEAINKKIIPDLIRAKYGDQIKYPQLYATGINDKAGKELAEILKSLGEMKAIQVSTRLQRHLHKLYKLPDLDEEIAAKDDEAFLQQAPEPTARPDPENPDPKKKVTTSEPCCGGHAVRLDDAQRQAFPISAQIEDAGLSLEKTMREMLKRRSGAMLAEVRKVIEKDPANARKKVFAIKLPGQDEYISKLERAVILQAVDAGKKAFDEIGLKPSGFKFAEKKKSGTKWLKEKLLAQILLVVLSQDTDIEKAVYFAFNEEYGTLSEENLQEAIERQVDAYFDKGLIATAALNLASSTINSARKEAFLSPEAAAQVESFVFVNADPVSAICKALNGKVFSKEEFESSDLTPPLHHNCKSYIRAQTAGKAGNLPVTGLKIDGSPAEIDKIMRTKTL